MRDSCWEWRTLRTTPLERSKHQNEPELGRLALKQLNECNLTAIPCYEDSVFVLMQVCDVSGQHEEIMEGNEHDEITLHDINFESASKSLRRWAMSVSIHHDDTAELKRELLLDRARFGMEEVVALLQKN